MGSGASDLKSSLNLATLSQDVEHQFAKVKAENDEVERTGKVVAVKRNSVTAAMAELASKVEEFRSLLKSGNPTDDEKVEAAAAVQEAHRTYRALKAAYIYQVGDIVEVRDEDMPALFIEGIVFGIEGNIVHVRLQDDEAYDLDDALRPAQVKEFDIDSNDVRKLRCWDFLEPGDRVRVKEGYMYFQGLVIQVSDDGEEVTVDFSDSNDQHAVEQETDDEIEGEPDVRVVHISFVEKIASNRVPATRFRECIRQVRTTVKISKAFATGGHNFRIRTSPREDGDDGASDADRASLADDASQADEQKGE